VTSLLPSQAPSVRYSDHVVIVRYGAYRRTVRCTVSPSPFSRFSPAPSFSRQIRLGPSRAHGPGRLFWPTLFPPSYTGPPPKRAAFSFGRLSQSMCRLQFRSPIVALCPISPAASAFLPQISAARGLRWAGPLALSPSGNSSPARPLSATLKT